MRFGMGFKTVRKDIKNAILWLIENKNVNTKLLCEFFEDVPSDTINSWRYRLKNNSIEGGDYNSYVEMFLEKHENNIPSVKIDSDIIYEIFWVLSNYNFARIIIGKLYNKDERYLSKLEKEKYKYKVPTLERQKEINELLLKFKEIYETNQNTRKRAACWLLINKKELTTREISNYCFLPFNTINKLKITYTDNELKTMSYGIKNVELNYIEELNYYTITVL